MNDKTQAPHPTVVFWGTYDLSKPRTRILREGLRANGIDVIEIHNDVWSRFSDKSQIGKLAMAMALCRVVLSYPNLIFRYMRAPAHALVIVPYLGQFDVLVLWAFARFKGKPVVWDMFLSLYDTVVKDRRMVAKRSLVAISLQAIEWLGCRAVDRVLLDTDAHAAYVARLFSLPDGRTGAVPVGLEPDVFQRQTGAAHHSGPTRVLFYGQLIPLHGIETILRAALSERGMAISWTIVGKGQQSELVEHMLASRVSDHIVRKEWLEYGQLIDEISKADICLGIFGGSDKAASVVPNKVYQCLFVGRTVITRDSPAMRQAFPITASGLQLVPPEDPEALLNAIDDASANGFPVLQLNALDHALPNAIGKKMWDQILEPLIDKS